MKKVLLAISVLALSACQTFTPQRYNISADNNVTLKAFGIGNISVGAFTGPSAFDSTCRGAGPIAPPDNMGFEAYIQKAFADELKVAGMFDDKTPKTILTGTVEQLSFSSSRAVTGGEWKIRLRINSSNGKSISVSEHYEFEAGWNANVACKQTADAYLPAVQNLIGKVIKVPEFRTLLVHSN
jgi:hypothetical protein